MRKTISTPLLVRDARTSADPPSIRGPLDSSRIACSPDRQNDAMSLTKDRQSHQPRRQSSAPSPEGGSRECRSRSTPARSQADRTAPARAGDGRSEAVPNQVRLRGPPCGPSWVLLGRRLSRGQRIHREESAQGWPSPARCRRLGCDRESGMDSLRGRRSHRSGCRLRESRT